MYNIKTLTTGSSPADIDGSTGSSLATIELRPGRGLRLFAGLRNLLAALLLAGLLMPTPARAIATCTAPQTNGAHIAGCEWVFLLYLCEWAYYDGGSCSKYEGSWVYNLICWKTWNQQGSKTGYNGLTGSATSVWDSSCNSGTVPASGDNVILGKNSIVTMDGNRTVNDFQLNGGCDSDGACQDTYLQLNDYNLTLLGNFTNNSYPEWNCGRFNNGWSYQSCEGSWTSMCEDTCDGHGWTIFGDGTSRPQQTIGGTFVSPVSGTYPTNETIFTYLQINNPNGVKLLSDVTVTGQLTLTSGFIDTNGHKLKVYSDCSTNPILGSGYVLTSSNGPLYLNFQGGGTETCTFPIADSNGVAKVTMTKYSTYKGTVKASTSATAPDTVVNMGVDLTDNANHYWTLAAGESDQYWDYAYLNGATWNTTTKPAPASSKTAAGLSTSATYDVTFKYCATAGSCIEPTEVDVSADVGSYILTQNKTAVAGVGKWTKYATPTNNVGASTTAKTGLTGAFGWFNVGKVGSPYAGVYGDIKLNWKASGSFGCGTICSLTAAASQLYLGKGSSGSNWYGVTTDPGDLWVITGVGSAYTLSSSVNASCLAKSGSTLVMAACNSGDANQLWEIFPYSVSGSDANGVSIDLASSPTTYVRMSAPTASGQQTLIADTTKDYRDVFWIMPPPPPDHYRFEFNKNGFLTCQPLNLTIKACYKTTAVEPACTTQYPANINITPGATKGNWNGLSSAPSDDFTGADVVTLADTTAEATTLSYSGASVTANNTTLECYDTSTSAAVSCTQTFVACSTLIDAVESGAANGSNLYTKLAGTEFTIDVLGPIAYTGNFVVDLVDASAGAWACPTTPTTLLDSAVYRLPAPQKTGNITSTLTSGKFTTYVTNADAVKNVRVRIQDDLGNCYNSTDYFTIRPASFGLSSSPASGSTAVAGASFTMTATALNSSGVITQSYTGTPAITTSAITDWTTTSIPAGSLTGSFGAMTAGTVTATNAFAYSDIGPLSFPDGTVAGSTSSAVGDSTYVNTSGSADQANSDCVSGSYSNTLVGGKYGCNIGSTALTTPRFIPASYLVTTAFTPGCGTFTYMGQTLGVALNVKAMNSLATPTAMTRVLSGPAVPTGWTMPSITSIIASDPTAANLNSSFTLPSIPATPAWPSYSALGAAIPAGGGTYSYATTGSSVFTRSTTTPADYESLKFTTTISDPDGVRIQTCTDGASTNGTITNPAPTATSTACQSPAATAAKVRYGMLKLDNAYGSELLPLYVPVKMLYWNGTGWAINTLDSCTTIVANNIAKSATFKGNMTGITITPPTIASGIGSIIVTSTGNNIGSADIAINLGATSADANCAGVPAATAGAAMSWLRGNWCGGPAAGYVKDPSARITFGTAKNPILFRREKY